MEIKRLYLGDLQTNCYLVVHSETKDVVIIDPASNNDGKITQVIEENALNPIAILITHGHFDHVGAVNQLKQSYDLPVYVSEIENQIMKDSQRNLSEPFMHSAMTASGDHIIKHGEELRIGEFVFKCIEVPGHTEESICFYMPAEGVLFSGDTLFHNSIGRTDFFNGPSNTLINEIKEKLMILPGETVVYPGHGFSTTIEDEMKDNYYLK
jgi:glyoxylase-like metal-dependent hydrolase (beta-lactamase superfamily II)